MMIDMKRAALTLLIGMVLILAASAARGDEAVLRWKFQEGDQLTYKMSEVGTADQMGMKIKNEKIQYMDWKIAKVEGDAALIEIVITRLVVKMENPMAGNSSFDSDIKEDDPNKTPNPEEVSVGKTYTIKMNTRGKVLGIEGFAAISAEILKKTEEIMGGNPGWSMQKKMFETMYSEEFLRKNMNCNVPFFPEGVVQSGTSWDEESEFMLPPFGDFLSKRKNTLESMDGGLIKSKISGSAEKIEKKKADDAAAANDPMAAAMAMMKVKKAGIEGALEFDNVKGMVKKRVQKLSLTLDLMGQEMKMSREHTLELVERKTD